MVKENKKQQHQEPRKSNVGTGGAKDIVATPSQPPAQRGGSHSGSNNVNKDNSNRNDRSNSKNSFQIRYPPFIAPEECLRRYNEEHFNRNGDDENTCLHPNQQQQQLLPKIIRGKLRVLPGNNDNLPAFVSCDRGHYTQDVLIPDVVSRNRSMHGDTVFVHIIGPVAEEGGEQARAHHGDTDGSPVAVWERDNEAGDEILVQPGTERPATWQDDIVQMKLWNPQVDIPRSEGTRMKDSGGTKQPQYKGKVVSIVPPHRYGSELGGYDGENEDAAPERRIVGSLKILDSGTTLLTPLNKCLPQFICPLDFARSIQQEIASGKNQEMNKSESRESPDEKRDSDWNRATKDGAERILYQATYTFGDWQETHKWPPCRNLQRVGKSCFVENEIAALLVENDVDHGDHPAEVLLDVERSVASGMFRHEDGTMGWKPTAQMYEGRRDYRTQRIFTIDPTTAKDLDDALHITYLPEKEQVEVGVHIADVSFFCEPGTAVDKEALRRATTVYLVDRTIPMLPRPLCEVACSLNENVERLAFSCVWRMNLDGTLPNGPDGQVWYGRSVIKSCARLDYATAQNIIDGTVRYDDLSDPDAVVEEAVWPSSRRPTGAHSMKQVADDVLLMHKVAMARRKLRFDNGALALNGIKLAFQLDKDGQTPLLAAPYPIRDSNRLVEEYMLLANYLVAQRLITHADGRALLRQHREPQEKGLDEVADVAKAAIGFEIDIRTSLTLHNSLHRLRQECSDPLVLMSVTQMLMGPMLPADYFAAGTVSPEHWNHFALNVPYYTHFTSPIRRYPDVVVHRLLQATLDETVESYHLSILDMNKVCRHCNIKRMASKTAQERCDRVFLSLFVRTHPMKREMGVVLSVGVSSFTVFVPSIGVSALLYLEEHKDVVSFEAFEEEVLLAGGRTSRVLRLTSKNVSQQWEHLEIRIFVKVTVTVFCRDKPPIDVKLRLEGPWTE